MGPIRPDFKSTNHHYHSHNEKGIGIGILGIFPFIAGLAALGRSFSPNSVLVSSLRLVGIVAVGVGVLIMILGYLEK